MITVEDARRILMATVHTTPQESWPLEEVLGRTLAEDVLARHGHPLFDMSAMDGYAIGDAKGPWKLVGRLPAGTVHGRPLLSGECVRIFTGAMVPENAHAVVMQERCTLHDGMLVIEGEVPRSGTNIRRKGEAFRPGDRLLQRGTRIGPAALGLLATDGCSRVEVFMVPSVSLVCTGNEFNDGPTPEPGRIFSSNDVMLEAAVREAGCEVGEGAFHCIDTIEDIRNAILAASLDGDLVITTGGVSVGEHDLVRAALERLGAVIHFHGVRQKPGKPMLFGELGNVPVFALPGNPRAVLVAWYEYVLPYLRAMQGDNDPWLRCDHLPITEGLKLASARAEFRAARLRDGRVQLLADEGSHLLGSLVEADALVYFPGNGNEVAAGDMVEVHYLPYR